MKRTIVIATAVAALAVAAPAAASYPSQGNFGLNGFDVTFTKADATMETQAGAHPFGTTVSLVNNLDSKNAPEGWLRDLDFEMPTGLLADPTAYPRCANVEFQQFASGSAIPSCPLPTQVGIAATSIGSGTGFWSTSPVFNLTPPPGALVRFGFTVESLSVIVDASLSTEPPYNPLASSRNTLQLTNVYASKLQLWGDPASPIHDELRGVCGAYGVNLPSDPAAFEFEGKGKSCPVPINPRPLITAPTSCAKALSASYGALSWEGETDAGSILLHDLGGNPQPFTGCGKLGFAPSIASTPGSENAETGSGLDFSVDFNDEGLTSRDGLAQSQIRKAVITLPKGVTINPSVAEGLDVCSPAGYEAETLHSAPGEGCPNASKLGSLEVLSPLVKGTVHGSVFLATQDDPSTTKPGAENPFDSLIALYLVIRDTDLGVLIKLPLKVEPDPKTGQLIATLDDVPQVPVSHFDFHFKEGARAPLVTPSRCGDYATVAKFYPWSEPSVPRTVTSSFEVTRGIGGGPCPPGGIPPFHPNFQAGSVNNNAGSFSPFYMRLLRADGEQDMTKFSSILPPGELGSLAGVSKCPDAAVAIAKQKTGRQERASHSCPANSLIGHTLAGAGVGEALTYVPGQIYLGGPYHGDPLSVIAVTPAVAGPYDAGTVVVRLALTLNPKTAEVEVDGANSDPIPHILKGIVLKARDLRVYVDRPNFTLNPTSCDESSAKATLFGSFLDVFSPLDDVPAPLSTRYQASNCLNLGFKPKLALNLKGGTKRGGHPGLSAIYSPRAGDANVEGLVVRLPRSAFLDQAHIRTICTRVQFAADACPPGAQYGYIKAWTPLLDEPLQGPVWLRSSSHKLPDLVFDLHGLVDIEVSTRIDSARGGIRASLEDLPDAPLSKVVLRMQGAKKGLIINSRDLCARRSKAEVEFSGQNGKQLSLAPAMRAQCGGKRKRPR